jgi:hypothetical protein
MLEKVGGLSPDIVRETNLTLLGTLLHTLLDTLLHTLLC